MHGKVMLLSGIKPWPRSLSGIVLLPLNLLPRCLLQLYAYHEMTDNIPIHKLRNLIQYLIKVDAFYFLADDLLLYLLNDAKVTLDSMHWISAFISIYMRMLVTQFRSTDL